ncbi:hypothetical protein H7U19_05055 [Hyunsoonleella sp. SJ7]|uniref:Methyltransferase domain-containing protein n=1 Tax=Hyunsoonleella aquatilis TaxID=2762758 RepID=A0A923KG83_9FLAO|nr:hypothetical protein [Hyunsoonleella aquatilis]MBC3757761.1 hypothetical protein [Hyunsoonleella aquatilis]
MNIKQIIKRVLRKKKKSPAYFKVKNYDKFDDFWVQKVEVEDVEDRLDFFLKLCKGKNVLHFGCTDWPIFRPEKNLHIQLSEVTAKLHGFDIDLEGIENLKQYVDQEYFSKFSEIPDFNYDVCLIPETIEHVDNVKDFLANLSAVKADKFLITAPNCFTPIHLDRNYRGKDYFIEVVHPDHNCWYSPYTLKNQIQKYSDLKVEKTYLFNNGMMICCEAVRNEVS